MSSEINFWWVTRPKRRLDSVPLVLSQTVTSFINAQWHGERSSHLALEKSLENAGLKREGQRRDQTGGGGRTYISWLKSLGLVFEHETNGLTLTLAGESLLNDGSPIEVLTSQVLKYQFPSAFSTITRNSKVADRFRVHPFIFLLRLLADSEIGYLTQDEIAFIVITQGENDSEKCLTRVKEMILDYRAHADEAFPSGYFENFGTGDKIRDKLSDAANTFINWLEFTALARRDEDRRLRILEGSRDKVQAVLADPPELIRRWDNEEVFQRRYGLDPYHQKDTRDLTKTQNVSPEIIAKAVIRNQFLELSTKRLILGIDADTIAEISTKTGYPAEAVEKHLKELYPDGGMRNFMPALYEMAFSGRDKAAEFEKATVEIFSTEFGFEASHVGPIGLTPDVLVLSDKAGFCGIIDNKAYSEYSISNDHHNRMVINYIRGLGNYYKGSLPLRFFSYIAGGFGRNIASQIGKITRETGIGGSALGVENLVRLIEENRRNPISHEDFGSIFSCGRVIGLTDFTKSAL